MIFLFYFSSPPPFFMFFFLSCSCSFDGFLLGWGGARVGLCIYFQLCQCVVVIFTFVPKFYWLVLFLSSQLDSKRGWWQESSDSDLPGHHKGQCTSSSVVLCHWTSQRSVHKFISCVVSLDITKVSAQVHWLCCHRTSQRSVHKFISCVVSLDITKVSAQVHRLGCVTGHHKGQCTESLVVLCHWTSQQSADKFIGCLVSLTLCIITMVSVQVYQLCYWTSHSQCTSLSVVLRHWTSQVYLLPDIISLLVI